MSDDLTARPSSPCPVCNGKALPVRTPHPERSVYSDGRVALHALAKSSCIACGSAFHAHTLSHDMIRTIYGGEYGLPGIAPKSDAARSRAYAGWIKDACSVPGSVFEVGCGSGALLRELAAAWPQATCFGVDPALPETERSDPRVRLERGFIEDAPRNLANFDLIIAVNVIEHAPDPVSFLASLRSRLALAGKLVIVCPAAEPPNSELLIYDHLFSLTPNALGLAAAKAALTVRQQHVCAPGAIGDFQMITFGLETSPPVLQASGPAFHALWAERDDYLRCWEQLDQVLSDRSRSASRLVAFGGGQAAALLRAYAPHTWARIELIVLDDVNEAWSLGLPVASYEKAIPNLRSAAILIAASPRVQGVIAERLQRDGLQSIRWDDLIRS